jgi:hypothetical protein
MKPAMVVFSALTLFLVMGTPKNAAPRQQQPAGAELPSTQGPGDSTKMLFEAMPNLHVVETEVVEFDFYKFGDLTGTPRIEGRRTTTSYGLNPGSPMPGALGICRHFVTATRQAGGEVLYDNNRNIVVLRFKQQGLETWAEIACDKDRYRVVIVERQGAGQGQSGTPPGATDLQKQSPGTAKPKVPSKSTAGSGRGDDVPKESVSFNKAPAAPKSQTSARLSIVRGDGKVLPCTDEPTLMRRGYTKGCTATEADKPLCDLLTSNQLQLVDTNMWSCHTKDGSQVEGALATDRHPSIQNPPVKRGPK